MLGNEQPARGKSPRAFLFSDVPICTEQDVTATLIGPGRRSEIISPRVSTGRFIAWTLERFGTERAVLTTSFGMEGCALIDMYASHGLPLTIVYLDTMFFFPETYALRDRMIARYPHLTFVNRGTALTPRAQAAIHGPELWKRSPERCCQLRKVEPMRVALAESEVWITAITRDQSAVRASAQLIGWDWQFQVLKICPLANWDRRRVWEYVRNHDVPYNPLHEQGYPSIGCTHCTAPVAGVGIDQYTRLGRWNGSERTECGIHFDGSGI